MNLDPRDDGQRLSVDPHRIVARVCAARAADLLGKGRQWR
jgi:hypothetical protein